MLAMPLLSIEEIEDRPEFILNPADYRKSKTQPFGLGLGCDDFESHSLRHFIGLGSLLSLYNFEFNHIAFLQSLITICQDCAVVDEHVWTILTTDKSKPLSVIKPLHCTFH